MKAGYYAELLDENPELLRRIIRFNLPQDEAAGTPPSGGAGLPAPVAAALSRHEDLRQTFLRNSRGDRRPDAGEADGRGEGFWDFARPTDRLALLSAEELSRLLVLASAALFADDIARIVAREAVLKMRSELSDAVVDYALLRGRWAAGGLRSGALAPLAAAARSMAGEEASTSERVRMLARVLAETLRADWPEALRMRADEAWRTLPLPAASGAVRADASTVAALRGFFMKIIPRELDAQWMPLFA